MIERFNADPEKRLLIDTLRQQQLICGNVEVATAIANICTLAEVPRGTEIIRQNADDNDLVFLIAGEVSIQVSGRHVAHRRAGQHVGEMSVVSPGTRRTAAVVALESCVTARIPEAEFNRMATDHPQLWRAIAAELVERLRQRNTLVRPVNPQPVIFIGSSVEGLDVARAIQNGLAHDPVLVRTWTDRVFTASSISIDALEQHAQAADFAVMVATADDLLEIRDQQLRAPRDNVIFELGLFMGQLGRRRSYLVHPRTSDLRLPTDLLGVTPLTYAAYADATELAARIAPVCNEIRTQVQIMKAR